jgi:hypothetical protein
MIVLKKPEVKLFGCRGVIVRILAAENLGWRSAV